MAMAEEAQVAVRDDSGTVTITGGGTLTFLNAGAFGEKLRAAAAEADEVPVDLRGAAFIDTQIVQDLGRAAVTMLRRGKRLRALLRSTAYPLRVLRISGYEGIMDIEVEPD